jgi:hypothetical protein
MEIKLSRILLICILTGVFTEFKSQDARYVKKGLLSVLDTYSVSTFTDINQNLVYFHGKAEYYISEKLSFSGQGIVNVG